MYCSLHILVVTDETDGIIVSVFAVELVNKCSWVLKKVTITGHSHSINPQLCNLRRMAFIFLRIFFRMSVLHIADKHAMVEIGFKKKYDTEDLNAIFYPLILFFMCKNISIFLCVTACPSVSIRTSILFKHYFLLNHSAELLQISRATFVDDFLLISPKGWGLDLVTCGCHGNRSLNLRDNPFSRNAWCPPV